MKTELLSPAGNIEKLRTAFSYGADAAYMGLTEFSLRMNADNFKPIDMDGVVEIKRATGKRLYCAANILFKEDQIEKLKSMKSEIGLWPFDAFIVSDMGAAEFFKMNFPEKELHLSTQASCLNSAAVKAYRRMGFSRIIMAREASIDDIKRIKDSVPDMEIETFVHGAMCMAYSGRCILSSFLAGRSANRGDCTHSCRWKYRLEEEQRPGEYFPIEENNGYTTILSSKDLCMIDHLEELKDAGVSSFKIEGRMKSVYYVALVTRAYRKALDKEPNSEEYKKDLFDVSHRPYTTGFFFGENDLASNLDGYERSFLFLGTVAGKDGDFYEIDVKNRILSSDNLDFITPERTYSNLSFELFDESLESTDSVNHQGRAFLKTDTILPEGSIIRKSI